MKKTEQPGLTPVAQKFIVHWGELGTRWGISRTVAQVHALLYLSQAPLDVQAICESLKIARSNASASLRELEGWGIVRSVHLLGDRREHFEAMADVWQMLATLVQARKRRECDPALAMLRECAEEAHGESVGARFVETRIRAMRDLFETLGPLAEEFTLLPNPAVRGLIGLRGRLRGILKPAK